MIDKNKIKYDSFGTMFAFMQMGKKAADYETLYQNAEDLWHLMCQKTAGQNRANNKKDISFENLDMLMNSIVLEVLVLYCCGELERLKNE